MSDFVHAMLHLLTTGIGTYRRFAATQYLGRIRSEADSKSGPSKYAGKAARGSG
jgi:hypothetical protein